MLRSSLLYLILAVVLSGCGTVKIHDAEFCGDLGPYGASCFHTLSDESRDIEKEAWDKERFGQVCTKPENFANWKKAILKLCRKNNLCEFEAKQQFLQFMARIEAFKTNSSQIMAQ